MSYIFYGYIRIQSKIFSVKFVLVKIWQLVNKILFISNGKQIHIHIKRLSRMGLIVIWGIAMKLLNKIKTKIFCSFVYWTWINKFLYIPYRFAVLSIYFMGLVFTVYKFNLFKHGCICIMNNREINGKGVIFKFQVLIQTSSSS